MKFLYLFLNLGSIIIPFIFSFHPKIKFYSKWKSLFIGIIVMMSIFIPWDILFTNHGIWGFNEKYITGYKILNLPIEEWLFFICIPYACLFTHYCLVKFFPKIILSDKASYLITTLLFLSILIVLTVYFSKWYTLINFSYALIILTLTLLIKPKLLNEFYPTFLVILLPFFIINGVLTGTGIEGQVVWYNDLENLGFRLKTIPFEDIFYALGMLLTVALVMNKIDKKNKKRCLTYSKKSLKQRS
ncbi:MAG: lycopene cyclase domain-containing protein [Flavobacteriaceae bacterium]|jgi:lycopene cyclase domain-containing protein